MTTSTKKTSKTSKTKTNDADNARFNEIEDLVTTPENKTRLQQAATADEIREIAGELGVDTSRDSRDMGKFIFKLKMIGVDFVALAKADAEHNKQQLVVKASRLDAHAHDLPIVRLWAGAVVNAADDSGAFAVVDAEGTALEYGGFASWEKVYTPGDLISAEQSAALRAVYIASRAREAAGVEEVSLWLTTTCPQLDQMRLKVSGARRNVAVDITVDDDDLAAVQMAESPGYRNVKTVSRDELINLVESDTEAQESLTVSDPEDPGLPEDEQDGEDIGIEDEPASLDDPDLPEDSTLDDVEDDDTEDAEDAEGGEW